MANGRSSHGTKHHLASDRSRRRSRSRDTSPPATARRSSLLTEERHRQRNRSTSQVVPRELFPNLTSSHAPRSGHVHPDRASLHYHQPETSERTRKSRHVGHHDHSSRKEHRSPTRSQHTTKHRDRNSSRSPSFRKRPKEDRELGRSEGLGDASRHTKEDHQYRLIESTSKTRKRDAVTESEDDYRKEGTSRTAYRHKRLRSQSPSSAGQRLSSKDRKSHRTVGEDRTVNTEKTGGKDKPRHKTNPDQYNRSPSSHRRHADKDHDINRPNRAGSVASDRSARIREQTWARVEQRPDSPNRSLGLRSTDAGSTYVESYVDPHAQKPSKSPVRDRQSRRTIQSDVLDTREPSNTGQGNERLSGRRRSRSRSVQSFASRVSHPQQSGRASPNMYNEYPPRGRQHSSGHHRYSRSPARQSSAGHGYSGEYGRGGRESRGSPPARGYSSRQSPPPTNQGQSRSPHYSQDQPTTSHGGNTPHGRGSGTPTGPGGRGHFQNLSWTPDKGSRGGVAPSERKLPTPRTTSTDATETVASDVSAIKKTNEPERPPQSPQIRDESTTQTKIQIRDASTRPIPEGPRSSRPESKQDRKEPIQMAPPSKPAIKFEMKVPTAPALAKRSNPIQATPKAPSKPSVFLNPVSGHDDRSRRPEPTSPRAKHPPPRFGGPHYDDYQQSHRSSHQDPYRSDKGSYKLDRRDPYPPPHMGRDRRPYDSRDVDIRSRGPLPPSRVPPKSLKSSKPRRKRFKKVLKKHVRAVLPPRTLPSNWSKSDFVYFPRPDRHSVVGAGTYGKVFKAHNVYLNHCVALKTLPLTKIRRKATARDYTSRDKKRKRQERFVKDGLHLTSLREIKLLKSISHQHENLVGIREIFLEGPSCNLVFDYFEFDMHGIIYSAQVALEDSMTKDLVRQVFQGLDYLHTKSHILHRDIKAANILVGANGQVRITDFGLAKQVKPVAELESQPWYKKKFEHSNRVITTPYRSPELLLGATLYGGEVDVWSAGCVLFEAFLKKLPFQGTGEDVDHLLTIWKILGLPNANLYPEVVDLEWYWLFMTRVQPKKSIFGRLYQNRVTPQLYHLLRCIFQHDPKKRPTAAQVLRHPFFTTELPLPQSAGSVLQTVDGEWHELEYKMIRDKEKASTRRKHENSVIIGYLKHKRMDHEKKLIESVLESDLTMHSQRVDFYKTEQESFKQRLEAKPVDEEDDTDHTKQVAEMKKTHGDMYMNAARRGRYRGVAREKVDEKLLQEAWKWYEDENKKGLNPVPIIMESKDTPVSKSTAQPQNPSIETLVTTSSLSRNDRKRDHEAKVAIYHRQVARYQARKPRLGVGEKRSAGSPLVDNRDYKKSRDED